MLPVASVTIDGEGVACGPDGVSDSSGCVQRSAARARAMRSYMSSIYWSLTASIYDLSRGQIAGGD